MPVDARTHTPQELESQVVIKRLRVLATELRPLEVCTLSSAQPSLQSSRELIPILNMLVTIKVFSKKRHRHT